MRDERAFSEDDCVFRAQREREGGWEIKERARERKQCVSVG